MGSKVLTDDFYSKTICLQVLIYIGEIGLWVRATESTLLHIFKKNKTKTKKKTFSLFLFFFSGPHEKTWKWIEVSPIVHTFIRRATDVPKRRPKEKNENRAGAAHLQPNRETRTAATADHTEFETVEESKYCHGRIEYRSKCVHYITKGKKKKKNGVSLLSQSAQHTHLRRAKGWGQASSRVNIQEEKH